jgi:hypothetical protein
MTLRSPVRLLVPSALALLLGAVALPDRQDPQKPQDPGPQQGPQLPDLVAALEKTEGCLGVEAGRMRSGKQVIFAWFEDKKAVLRWYRGRTHQQVMRQLAPAADRRKPLEFIEDDSGPIMVVASLTMADKPHFEQISMPISQIAIELYQPLPGGTYLGGRFTPMAIDVKGSRDYLRQEAAEASTGTRAGR